MFVNIYLIYLLIRVTNIQKNNLFEMNFRLQYSSCVGKKKKRKKKRKERNSKSLFVICIVKFFNHSITLFQRKKRKEKKDRISLQMILERIKRKKERK